MNIPIAGLVPVSASPQEDAAEAIFRWIPPRNRSATAMPVGAPEVPRDAIVEIEYASARSGDNSARDSATAPSVIQWAYPEDLDETLRVLDQSLSSATRGDPSNADEKSFHVRVYRAQVDDARLQSPTDGDLAKALGSGGELLKVQWPTAENALKSFDLGAATVARTTPLGTKAEPILLFIHGAFSHFEAAFGALASASHSYAGSLKHKYLDRTYAFNHGTVRPDPIDNALELLKILPENSHIDVIAHSRGGLIAELLCGVEFEDDLAAMSANIAKKCGVESDELAKEIERFEAVFAAVRAKNIRVHRLLRVGTPALGTALAQRIPAFVSAISTGLGLVLPNLRVSPVYKAVSALIRAVLSKRGQELLWKGIAAMNPSSTFITLLNLVVPIAHGNKKTLERTKRLNVAGDYSGESLFSRAAEWALNQFFGDQNDLVVGYQSMLGGPSTDANSLALAGADVTHFGYFSSHARSLDREVRALFGLPVATRSPEAAAITGPKPIVVIVPGIMGSELEEFDKDKNRSTLIWANLIKIPFGIFSRLALPSASGRGTIRANHLMPVAYSALEQALKDLDYDVVGHPYDWRLSTTKLGTEFADRLKEIFSHNAGREVAIIAHSMGGLVARRGFLALDDELKKRVKRLVCVGSPHRGAWLAGRALLGMDSLIDNLERVDFAHDKRETMQTIQSFHGLWSLLPDELFANRAELEKAKEWLVDRESDAQFDAASKDRQSYRDRWDKYLQTKLHANSDVHVAVLGAHDPAPTGLGVDGHPDTKFVPSDSRVPHSSSMDGDDLVYYVRQSHMWLPSSGTFLDAIAKIIHEPRNAGLAKTPENAKSSRPLSETPLFTLASRAPDAVTPEQTSLSTGDRAHESGGSLFWSGARVVEQRESPNSGIIVRTRHASLRVYWAEDSQPIDEKTKRLLVLGHFAGTGIDDGLTEVAPCFRSFVDDPRSLARLPSDSGCSIRLIPDAPYDQRTQLHVVGLGDEVTWSKSRIIAGYQKFFRELFASTNESHYLVTAIPGVGRSHRSEEVEALAAAIVEACIATNRWAAENPPPRQKSDDKFHPPISEITFVCSHRDIARQCAYALRSISYAMQSTLSSQEIPKIEPWVEQGDGYLGTRLIDSNYAVRPSVLTITSRGRADRQMRLLLRSGGLGATESQRVTEPSPELIAQAHRLAQLDDTVGREKLVNAFIDSESLALLQDAQPTLLKLDSTAASIPWEWLTLRKSGTPTPIVRQLLTTAPTRPIVSQQKALVIGNPVVGPGFRALPGAAEEAALVHQVFSDELGLSSSLSVSESDDDIRVRLGAVTHGTVRVLHIASHGYLDRDETGPSVILGKDYRLRPEFWRRLREVPEIVFLNCCDIGRVEAQWNEYVTSVATSCMKAGVRVFVGAAWPIDDSAARLFAVSFYRHLAQGEPLITAVNYARRDTQNAGRAGNTYAAFQVYGDPNYVFRHRASVRAGSVIQTSQDALDACASLMSELRRIDVDDDVRSVVRARLLKLEAAVADRVPSGRRPGQLGELLRWRAMLWLELGDAVVAERLLQDSTKLADTSFRAWSWLAELEGRRLCRAPTPTLQAAKAIADQSMKRLLAMEQLGRNVALELAHAHARRAAFAFEQASDGERQKDVAAATALWRKACSHGGASAKQIHSKRAEVELALWEWATTGSIETPPTPSTPGSGPSAIESIVLTENYIVYNMIQHPSKPEASVRTETKVLAFLRNTLAKRSGNGSRNWTDFLDCWFAVLLRVLESRLTSSSSSPPL